MAKFRKTFSYRVQKYGQKAMGRAFGYIPGLGLDYLQTKGIPVGVGWPDYLAKKTKNLFWRRPWGRSKPGRYIGSARPIYGSAPGKKPVYGSNPNPPIYGSPPISNPVVKKMAFLTPLVEPIEKWQKGKLC